MSVAREQGLGLSLLGPLQVTCCTDASVAIALEKGRALLGYLAMEPNRPHQRESLAELLWPEHGRDEALVNLRQVLYRLRLALTVGPHRAPLQIDRRSITFQTGPACRLDVDEFILHLDAGQLERAIELYRGDLLEDVVAPSEAYTEWLEGRRQRLRSGLLEAIYRLAVDGLAAGRHERARGYAQRYLAMEPWHEPSHRVLMRSLAATGQRSAAILQYHTCRDLLQRELGIEPEPDSVELFTALQQGELLPAERVAAERDRPVLLGHLQQKKLSHVFLLFDRDFDGLVGGDDLDRPVEQFRINRGWKAGCPEHRVAMNDAEVWWSQMKPWASAKGERLTHDDWFDFWAAWHAAVAEEATRSQQTMLEVLKGSGNVFFDLLDANRTGFIGEAEFAAWQTAWVPGVNAAAMFARLDADGDGKLYRDDVIRLLKEFYLSNDPEAPGNFLYGQYF